MTAKKLGLLRIIFFLTLLATIPTSYLSDFSHLDFPLFCSEKTGVWINISLGPQNTKWISWVLQLSLLSSAIGFLTSVSLWTSFATLVILNMQGLKFCYNNFSIMALAIPLFLWALLDQDSGLRLDSLLRPQKQNAKASENGLFLIKCLQTHFCIIFFLSGVAKLRFGGLGWIFSDSMKNILIVQNYFYEHNLAYNWFQPLQKYLFMTNWLPKFIALSTVLLELAAPLALFSKRWGPSIVLHLFLLQAGIYVFMYIDFFSWIALYFIYPFYFVSVLKLDPLKLAPLIVDKKVPPAKT